MKKYLITALLLALPLAAQAVDVSTKVGVVSNYVARGVSGSGERASATATVRAAQNGFFGDVEVYTLQERSDLKTTAQLGYGFKVGDVAITTAYSHRFFTGQGEKSTARNFGEVIAKAAYKGVNGTVAQVVNRTATGGYNTYGRIGYAAPAFLGVVADIGTAYTHFRNEGVTRHTNVEASLSYNLRKNIKLMAFYSWGGQNAAGKDLDDQTVFGAWYNF